MLMIKISKINNSNCYIKQKKGQYGELYVVNSMNIAKLK